MRLLFTWIVAFGVLAGFCGRALAADPCAVILAMHAQEHSEHHHDPKQPCDPSHDQKCPVEHHQQGHCGHAMPLAAEVQAPVQAGGFRFSLAPVRSEALVLPEEPYAELDKPPLI
jgi:hypothetical protein